MKTAIGISEKNTSSTILLLSAVLADEMVLYVKTRKFHWNVSGDSFMELHKLFQNQYTELEEIIDQTAERIGKLGGKAIGTMKEFCKLTRLKECASENNSQKEMIKELLNDHNTLIVELRKDILQTEQNNDAGTTDFLTSVMLQHETIAWVLSRYLS